MAFSWYRKLGETEWVDVVVVVVVAALFSVVSSQGQQH